MAYWRLFYHIIFATRLREPLITPDIEQQLHGYVAGKAASLGALIHAINGIEDHLHIVASVPPKLAIGEFVGQIKGSSAHHINQLPGREERTFEWQRGYGVLSFGEKNLDWVVRYVRRQKERHHDRAVLGEMERADDADE